MKRRRAIIICVDGVRPDALLLADTPHIKSLVKNKECAYSFHATCDEVPVSYPSWSSTLTGTSFKTHGVLDNDGTVHACATPSCFKILRDTLKCKTAAYLTGWYGIRHVLGGEKGSTFDMKLTTATDVDELHLYAESDYEKATEDVLAALRSDSRLTLYYAHGPDHAGHMHGFSPHTQEYLRAIENMDASVKRIWDCIRALREDERRNEEWLIIMTTDHGGTSRSDMPRAMQERMDCARDCGYGQRKCEGVHGLGDCACHRNTFVIVDCGAATKVGEILPAPRNMDVAATVLAYFGDDVSQRKDIVGIPVGLIRNCGLNDAAQLVTLDAWRVMRSVFKSICAREDLAPDALLGALTASGALDHSSMIHMASKGPGGYQGDVLGLPQRPGFYICPGALGHALEAQLAHLCLHKYCAPPHVTNRDAHIYRKKRPKLAWASLGYNFDWTKREYREMCKTPFPEELHQLTSLLLQLLTRRHRTKRKRV